MVSRCYPALENAQPVTASPGKVGKIAQAALVLVLFEVGGWLHTRDQPHLSWCYSKSRMAAHPRSAGRAGRASELNQARQPAPFGTKGQKPERRGVLRSAPLRASVTRRTW